MKFTIGEREYSGYELSNKQVLNLLDSDNTTPEEKAYLTQTMKERFKHNLCPENGEDDNDVFAHFFGSFVNGKMTSKKKAAEVMCREHRYLQNEMFKVCLEYIKKLSENYENGQYDPRNEYAVRTSSKIIENLKEIDWPY